jgi:hypothetical protein
LFWADTSMHRNAGQTEMIYYLLVRYDDLGIQKYHEAGRKNVRIKDKRKVDDP